MGVVLVVSTYQWKTGYREMFFLSLRQGRNYVNYNPCVSGGIKFMKRLGNNQRNFHMQVETQKSQNKFYL